ncbi:CDP-diacylglycerol--glycerol-3-phosphate 3-phosphatidyltransferase [Thecaphora frezii]
MHSASPCCINSPVRLHRALGLLHLLPLQSSLGFLPPRSNMLLLLPPSAPRSIPSLNARSIRPSSASSASSAFPALHRAIPCPRLVRPPHTSAPPRRHATSVARLDPSDVRASLHDPHHLVRSTARRMQLPAFAARSDQIELLSSPTHFYQTLKHRIAAAQHRIFLASLYVGKEEIELVHHLRDALRLRRSLRLTVLTDALRSTREPSPQPSCASLLASLARDFPDQVDLRLYHTPKLKGLTKRLVGKRFNEGWGLQHMKIYGFDDDVIVSGANLSRDYFTNRKDRYLLVSQHARFADHLHSLVLLAARFSYSLVSTEPPSASEKAAPYSAFRLEWDGGDRLLLGEDANGTVSEGGTVAPTAGPSSAKAARLPERGWSSTAQSSVEAFTQRWHQHTLDTLSASDKGAEVLLVPLIQMGPLHIRQETEAVPQLFHLASDASALEGRPATLDLTSGYFSLYPPYKALLSSPSKNAVQERVRIICAAPKSNGFFQSRGFSGWIPEAYTWFEKRFWDALRRSGRLWNGDAGQGGVEVREWKKPGWTYHAKGIWYTPPATMTPTMVHVGSSNYGSRSSDLDLECTLLLSTRPESRLSTHLAAEVEGLRSDAHEMVDEKLFRRPDRKVRWRVKAAAWLIGSML